MYAYHVKGRGWCDLGYNFLVDRFGRVFEGRYGGAQLPVLGAHTGSFNTNSLGIALIGNFEKAAPTQAMLEKTARVIAWKFDANYRSPKSTVVLAGTKLLTISGHRDTKATACPGAQLYEQLPWLRHRVDVLMGGSVATPIYRFALKLGLRAVGPPFWGDTGPARAGRRTSRIAKSSTPLLLAPIRRSACSARSTAASAPSGRGSGCRPPRSTR